MKVEYKKTKKKNKQKRKTYKKLKCDLARSQVCKMAWKWNISLVFMLERIL